MNLIAVLKNILWIIELITVFIFIIEYLARFHASEKRLKYVFSIYSIIDLLAIIPTLVIWLLPGTSFAIGFMKALRIFKVFRVFRFMRFMRDGNFFFGKISIYVLNISRLIFTILMIFFISSGLFYHVESSVNDDVNTFGDAFYFTVVTLTTVGFGDINPISSNGRWVTILMIISGIILIPWQAGKITREWLKGTSKKNVTCSKCGLQGHDEDASHCKSCGNVIFQNKSL